MTNETYVEMELVGPGDQALGFVEGFRLAMWGEEAAWFADQENVELEGLLEGIRTKLDLERHVILPKGLADRIAAALESSEKLKIKVGAVRAVDYAELEFRYEVYSRDEAAAVRSLIEENLPEGVRLEGYEPEEKVEEDAKGVELYSPVHDYVLRASGRYVGPVPGIIEMGRRLANQSFIKRGKVVLHHAS